MDGRGELRGVVAGQGHQQAVAQELRRQGTSGAVGARGRRRSTFCSPRDSPSCWQGSLRPPGPGLSGPARVLTLKLTGSTRSLCACRSLRADRAPGRSSRCPTAVVSASATFLPWALTWAEPGLRSKCGK